MVVHLEGLVLGWARSKLVEQLSFVLMEVEALTLFSRCVVHGVGDWSLRTTKFASHIQGVE